MTKQTKDKKQYRKESIFCTIHGLESKETDSDNLVKGGYIATTHLDSGWYDPFREVFVKDRIDLKTLQKWKEEINDGVPRANKVSINHNREEHVAGVGIKGTAEIHELPGGEHGLYVDTLVDKTKENYPETEYRISNGLLDSYSIEYDTGINSQGKYYDNAATEVDKGSYLERTLMPGTILDGWTLASQPMNEHAIMIKELRNKHITEDVTMTENKEEPIIEEKPKEEPKVEEVTKVEEPSEEAKELMKLGKEYKEIKAKESKEKHDIELKESLKGDILKELKEVKVDDKVAIENKEAPKESKEFIEFKESIKPESKSTIQSKALSAAKLAQSVGLLDESKSSKNVFQREYKYSVVKDGAKSVLEFKGLGITTNQNTDTDYLLSSAELNDVFDPIIYSVLNEVTNTWNILTKEDLSSKGNNQVQFKLKIAANTTAAAYTGNSVDLGNTTRIKYMTKFKKYQVGVEIDGDMIASAKGASDVWGMEIMDSTEALMSVINAALYAENGTETSAGIIGFEYITDQAGNTSLYNVARSQANGLASTTTADNYINASSADISLSLLRQAKRKAVATEGAELSNCVFFTSYIQGDKFRGIYDAIQRTTPTSSRFGFEGRPEFDGVPIFEDKDCNDDDWFLVDLTTHKIGMWVPPTLEMLGKDGDSDKGFIKTYFATYNTAPRRMVQIYGAATS